MQELRRFRVLWRDDHLRGVGAATALRISKVSLMIIDLTGVKMKRKQKKSLSSK